MMISTSYKLVTLPTFIPNGPFRVWSNSGFHRDCHQNDCDMVRWHTWEMFLIPIRPDMTVFYWEFTNFMGV